MQVAHHSDAECFWGGLTDANQERGIPSGFGNKLGITEKSAAGDRRWPLPGLSLMQTVRLRVGVSKKAETGRRLPPRRRIICT